MNESTLVPREEMRDLDWLARNVHFWDESAYAAMCGGVERVMWVSDSAYGQMSEFKIAVTKDQWLSRRLELQNKPSWKDAPEWANFLSQGFSGAWFWHEFKPEIGDCAYFSVKGKYTIHIAGEVLGDWRDTLEKRPSEREHSSRLSPDSVDKIESVMQRNEGGFSTFVSVEDAATSKQHDPVNSPSHYASGGIECIEAIKASMSHEAFLGYLKGNVQKYTWRYEKKVNPAEDLKKARWYLSKLIEEQK